MQRDRTEKVSQIEVTTGKSTEHTVEDRGTMNAANGIDNRDQSRRIPQLIHMFQNAWRMRTTTEGKVCGTDDTADQGVSEIRHFESLLFETFYGGFK